MCTMVDLEMFSTMEFFLMIRVYKGYHALKVKECQVCVGPARLLIGDAMGLPKM